MLPPHLTMMQAPGGPAKPLFPSAVPSSSPGGSAIVGADFKPITTGILLFLLAIYCFWSIQNAWGFVVEVFCLIVGMLNIIVQSMIGIGYCGVFNTN